MKSDLFGNPVSENVFLRDRFMEPPFSVLDSKGGDWQARKKAWKRLGIASEVGRDAACMPGAFGGEVGADGLDKYGRKPMSETSIFDPALCELMYNWYCPPGARVLDPFAGGSVRGIVANYLGHNYTGIDIRQEQVDSNRDQAIGILPVNRQPQWYVGDSEVVLDGFTKTVPDEGPQQRESNEAAAPRQDNKKFDFVFSCPPYADLEKYSDDPADLSNMPYDVFIEKYRRIIKKSIDLLKPGGYACFVVGDIRDKKGYYRDFVSHTKQAFIDAGAGLYNEAILLQPLGTAMLRAAKIFEASGKLTKVHENVLVFKKQ